MTSRRDELLGRVAARMDRGGPSGSPTWGRVGAVVLGWLVLMAIWGFGRAWHGGWAPVELTIGLVAGTTVGALAWRRAGRRR